MLSVGVLHQQIEFIIQRLLVKSLTDSKKLSKDRVLKAPNELGNYSSCHPVPV